MAPRLAAGAKRSRPPGGGVHWGLEGVKAHLRDFLEMWEMYTLEELRVIDAAAVSDGWRFSLRAERTFALD